ncbi:MAG TPA: transposase [Blastocatellia bacterium]|nr:transposase [Blastocatellia bacterium]
MECSPIIVGGVEDHVHMLARLSRTITQAEWVKELKRVSSLWLKEQDGRYADFYWQAGYACFSVSQSNLDRVKAYITNQERHHHKISFQDELRALFRKHGLEWDERYVWD